MDNSPLAKLSPELRNRVYEYALIFDDTQLHVTADHYNAKMHTTNECAELRPLALTTACRQIREETVQMFYHYNTFSIHFEKRTEDQDRDEACLLQRFAVDIGGVNAANLRRIVVSLERDDLTAHGPEHVEGILQQLLTLHAFALGSPNCEVLCNFPWTPKNTGFQGILTNEELLHMPHMILLPLVQFRVEAGTASLSKAITQLEKAIENSFGYFVPHCNDLVELLKKLVTDLSLVQEDYYWEREVNNSR